MIRVIYYSLGLIIAIVVGILRYDTVKNRSEKARWPVVNALSCAGLALWLYYLLIIILDHVGLYPD